MESLYSHQKKVDDIYHSRFLFVHEDTFGRSFDNIYEIGEYIKNDGLSFNIDVVSRDSERNINVFLLTIKDIEPIEELDAYANENELYGIMSLDSVRYYTSYPCDFNYIKE